MRTVKSIAALRTGSPAGPASVLHRWHPARAPRCEFEWCDRPIATTQCRGRLRRQEWTRNNKRFCASCIARRNDRKRKGLDPDARPHFRAKRINPDGYRYLTPPRDHPKYPVPVTEHRLVMEAELGRYLQPWENVHHRNGIRDDNRLENLELWTVPQPTGQRPEDLVAWAVKEYPDLARALLR